MKLFEEMNRAEKITGMVTHEPDIADRAKRQIRVRDRKLLKIENDT